MKTTEARRSSEMFSAANPRAFERFKQMRDALSASDSLDTRTYETVIAMQFAMLGKEIQFKLHAIQLFSLGVSPEHIRAMVLAGVGLTMVLCDATRILMWVDEAYDEFEANFTSRSDIAAD